MDAFQGRVSSIPQIPDISERTWGIAETLLGYLQWRGVYDAFIERPEYGNANGWLHIRVRKKDPKEEKIEDALWLATDGKGVKIMQVQPAGVNAEGDKPLDLTESVLMRADRREFYDALEKVLGSYIVDDEPKNPLEAHIVSEYLEKLGLMGVTATYSDEENADWVEGIIDPSKSLKHRLKVRIGKETAHIQLFCHRELAQETCCYIFGKTQGRFKEAVYREIRHIVENVS